MPPNEPKPPAPRRADTGVEGSWTDAEGRDQGDASFHQVQMESDADAEATSLRVIRDAMVSIEEGEAAWLSGMSARRGIEAYETMLAKYAGHPSRTLWEQRVQEIRSTLKNPPR